MKTFLRLLLSLAVLAVGNERAWAHHISGFVYCDENASGVIDAGDRPLESVVAKATSLTANPLEAFTDGTNVAGFYFITLPSRSDDLKCELASGLPVGSTVIVPADGVYPSLPIITGSSATNKQENVNFLLDGCQLCGNGVPDPGEECDDGNTDDNDGCNALCQDEFCGDTIIQSGLDETCDPKDSVQSNGQLCRQDCTYCGDGITDPVETCDDGNAIDTDACRNNCTKPECGDGIVDTNEQCDDGNTIDTDTCRNNCTKPECGDGIVDTNEQCDDGNTNNEDGCNATCVPEICGDGIIQAGLGEQCDPPNVGDCSADCHLPEICFDFIDNDGDGLIDCLDPDCDCGLIGRDPGAIRFGRATGSDLFTVHGAFIPTTPVDPLNEIIGVLLTNANGKILERKVPVGTLRKIGRNLYRFRDRVAQRNRTGLARLDVRFFPNRGNWTFVIKTYGDLRTKATEAKMAVQWVVGDDPFLNQSEWLPTPHGWLLVLPPS